MCTCRGKQFPHLWSAVHAYSWRCCVIHQKDILSPDCNFMCVFMVGTFPPWVSRCTHIHMYMYNTCTCTCSPVVLHCVSHLPVCCVCMTACVFFPGCHGGDGREEGREEVEFRERSGRKEEVMSVGESTTSTVHVTCVGAQVLLFA